MLVVSAEEGEEDDFFGATEWGFEVDEEDDAEGLSEY